ncbi:hypothetical protein NBRC10512_007041 [Rhodotorula toruloides]|uniref:RHTO0S16e02806g1_1 n=2 Tax=Rhodotorula toruloides TaxID=5286 RepID=A0A061BM86_RHOTO|nr:uncharacterized protein RHTO_02279 [Rhodotorula toruloides NP11]EMS21053.1 hypothetical protein RHTO_02279 [Rhodotorula toruloides NP11]CDR48173.1 RHTO0S16e02806g1_1 [Rhodotorula toruloides]
MRSPFSPNLQVLVTLPSPLRPLPYTPRSFTLDTLDQRQPCEPLLPRQATPSAAAATAQPLPPAQSDGVPSRSSSGDSASPNLASSPLESFAAISTALPTSATGNTPGAGPGGVGYHDRQDSFESPSVGAMPEEESFSTRRHSVDEPDDALRRYRAGLYKYTASRYDEFQADLQRKKGLQHRRSSQ